MTLYKNVNGERIPMTIEEAISFESARIPKPLSSERIGREISAKLAETDWTQVADVDLSVAEKAQWNGYRAALRALDRTPRSGNLGLPVPPSDIKRNGR